MIGLIILALVLADVGPQAPTAVTDAKSLTFASPTLITTLDVGKLKGEPIQLAWSPDQTKLYLETGQRTRIGTMTNQKSYVISASDHKLEPIETAPDWAKTYWTWKSNKWAPGDHSLAIGMEGPVQRAQTVTSSPNGGALAKGGASGADAGTGTTVEDAARAAYGTQVESVLTLRLKGEVVGEYVNLQFMPGYTFGWSPQTLGNLIAYRNQAGRLSVMDQKGGRQEVAGTKNSWLPAWSDDGSKIAFVQPAGRNKFDLFIVEVK